MSPQRRSDLGGILAAIFGISIGVVCCIAGAIVIADAISWCIEKLGAWL